MAEPVETFVSTLARKRIWRRGCHSITRPSAPVVQRKAADTNLAVGARHQPGAATRELAAKLLPDRERQLSACAVDGINVLTRFTGYALTPVT